MATPVVTVASGGLPVVDVTATTPKLGLPVSEALAGRGTAVTKVASGGMAVAYSTVVDYPPAVLPFTPASLVGLKGWWDASVTASLSLSGANITAVADQSGAGNNLGTGATFPTYSVTGLNSKPSMMFVGTNQALSKPAFAFGAGNTLTVFAVIQMNTSCTTYGRMLSYAGGAGDATSNAGFLLGRYLGLDGSTLYRNGNTAQTQSFSIIAPPRRIIGTINSSGLMTIYIDGVATTGNTLNAVFGASGTLYIGYGSDAPAPWWGAISEAGIATGFTNSTDVASLDTYFKNKWGL